MQAFVVQQSKSNTARTCECVCGGGLVKRDVLKFVFYPISCRFSSIVTQIGPQIQCIKLIQADFNMNFQNTWPTYWQIQKPDLSSIEWPSYPPIPKTSLSSPSWHTYQPIPKTGLSSLWSPTYSPIPKPGLSSLWLLTYQLIPAPWLSSSSKLPL